MKHCIILSLVLWCLVQTPLHSQSPLDTVQIRHQQLTEKIFVLFGQGGNIGLAIGQNYSFLIDDQFAPLSEKIIAKVGTITDKPIKYLVNSHWHGDHTGGNLNMANHGAIIIAHDNVYERMSTKQFRGMGRIKEASPQAALPQITFSENLTLNIDSTTQMIAFHFHNAHTDGDAMIYFPQENVIHTGDIFFEGRYPFVDLNSGGNLEGMIRAVDRALILINKDTKIIPGHGKIASYEDFENYRNFLKEILDLVRAQKKQGVSLEDMKEMNLLSKWTQTHSWNFIDDNKMLQIAYDSEVLDPK